MDMSLTENQTNAFLEDLEGTNIGQKPLVQTVPPTKLKKNLTLFRAIEGIDGGQEIMNGMDALRRREKKWQLAQGRWNQYLTEGDQSKVSEQALNWGRDVGPLIVKTEASLLGWDQVRQSGTGDGGDDTDGEQAEEMSTGV
jgi:hypothetical protein